VRSSERSAEPGQKRTEPAQGLARKGNGQTVPLCLTLLGKTPKQVFASGSLLCPESLLYTFVLMQDQGVWAEVKVGNEHLRLFAEHNAQGVQASVYNVISKTWIAPSNLWMISNTGRSEQQRTPRNTSRG
jgi:hypothetical protein